MNHRGGENPYEILGVSKDATLAEIKSAYRKLALRNHPDKVGGDANTKARASELFAKIGSAYEILSDDRSRKEYDTRSMMPQEGVGFYASDPFGSHGMGRGFGGGSGVFGGGFGDDPFFDFHRRAHAGGMGGRRSDPFELFERVFGEDFGMAGGRFEGERSRSGRPHDPFDDPFFSSPFGGMGGMMDRMMQQVEQSHEEGGLRNSSMSFSSSSMSSRGSGPGSESITTTTQIVNGKRVSRTERTVVKPDGTVERHVETSGDQDLLQGGSTFAPTIGGEGGRERKPSSLLSFGKKRPSRKKKDSNSGW